MSLLWAQDMPAAKQPWQSARSGCKTLLLTQNMETIGQMSCNPAIGGIGKGHLVKEIDALDGAMAKAADRAGIHFRILNSRKGPAVRATRAQADRTLYKMAMRAILEETPNLQVFQQEVVDLCIEHDQVKGVLPNWVLMILAPVVSSDRWNVPAGQNSYWTYSS